MILATSLREGGWCGMWVSERDVNGLGDVDSAHSVRWLEVAAALQWNKAWLGSGPNSSLYWQQQTGALKTAAGDHRATMQSAGYLGRIPLLRHLPLPHSKKREETNCFEENIYFEKYSTISWNNITYNTQLSISCVLSLYKIVFNSFLVVAETEHSGQGWL